MKGLKPENMNFYSDSPLQAQTHTPIFMIPNIYNIFSISFLLSHATKHPQRIPIIYNCSVWPLAPFVSLLHTAMFKNVGFIIKLVFFFFLREPMSIFALLLSRVLSFHKKNLKTLATASHRILKPK